MAQKQAEFTVDLRVATDFDKFVEAFRKEVIETGLDAPMKKTVGQLKTTLKFIINEQIQALPPTAPSVIKQINELQQPTINVPKSEEELLKHLTKGRADVTKYNAAKDYTTLSESGIVFGHGSKNNLQANRIALRMEIEPDESVESQYAKADDFFKDAVFALPDFNGNVRYYMNPGIDMTEFVKIKCSSFAGANDNEPDEGMSPADRFNRNRQNKGYADWTLKQDAVARIRNSFIDLTEVIDFLKEGDYDRAREYVQRYSKDDLTKDVEAQIDQLDSRKNLTPSAQAYTTAIDLVNNIKVVKKVTKETVTYTLVSSYDNFPDKEENFFEALMDSMRSWVVQTTDSWFNSLVKQVEKLIKKFESGK